MSEENKKSWVDRGLVPNDIEQQIKLAANTITQILPRRVMALMVLEPIGDGVAHNIHLRTTAKNAADMLKVMYAFAANNLGLPNNIIHWVKYEDRMPVEEDLPIWSTTKEFERAVLCWNLWSNGKGAGDEEDTRAQDDACTHWCRAYVPKLVLEEEVQKVTEEQKGEKQ